MDNKALKLTRRVICKTCDGKGGDESCIKVCMACDGRGVRVEVRQLGPGMIQQMQSQCSKCNGEGKTMPKNAYCKKCKGKKTVRVKETLDLYIAPGMREGETIPFKGKGDEFPGTVPGDILVTLRLSKHSRFKREGNDLHYLKEITLLESLTGFTMYIEHLDNRVLKVKSDEGKIYKPDEIQCIEHEGMPFRKNQFVKGNLYVKFKVIFPIPAELSRENKQALFNFLPGSSEATPNYEMTELDIEEVKMNNIDERAEQAKAKREREHGNHSEQYEEDRHGGAQQANCRTQ